MLRKTILILIIFTSLFSVVYGEESTKTIKAEVLEVKEEYQGSFNMRIVRLKVLEGEFTGQEVISEYIPIEYSNNNFQLKKGKKVLIRININSNGKISASIMDVLRVDYLKVLGILFLICVIIFGGLKGVLSVVSLGITGIILIKFMIPLIVKGYSPVVVSIVSTVVIILISFILIAGFTRKSLVAIIGTVGGTIIAGILAHIFTKLCLITGIVSEDVNFLISYTDTLIDFKGLYFSGVLIGVIGVVMDVSMSITSVIFELKEQNPRVSFTRLLGSGLKVGKDVMATMVNTLILAYVGSSMPLLLTFHFLEMPIDLLLNKEILSVEIIRSLCGSIGLILTIPLTSFVASVMVESQPRPREYSYRR